LIITAVYRDGKLRKSTLPGEELKPFTLKCNGREFGSQMVEVSREGFKALGLNERYFRPGIMIHLLKPADYYSLCRLMGVNYREARGIYLPPAGGEEKKVIGGTSERISGVRMIALPLESNPVDRVHELAHDILVNGSVSGEEREGFFRLAMSEVRRVLNRLPDSPEAEFVRKAAVNSNLHDQLAAIKHLLTFDHLTYEQRVLACELFAYAVEAKVTGKPIAGKVPVYIDMDLNRMGVKA
jgi:hypothetical protein